MLWTIMPLEAIMEGSCSCQLSYSELPWHNGATLLVEPLGSGKVKVVRLISTDPRHYLDPDLRPGNILELATLCRTSQ